MRFFALGLICSACALPVEEPCVLSTKLTEKEAGDRVENGRTVLVVTGPECGTDAACVRDRTVPRGSADGPALGYCALSCDFFACLPGTRCEEVNGSKFCLHAP
jgi:hypothetical protein